MKKFLAIFLAVIMCLAVLASCDNSKKENDEKKPATSETTSESQTEPQGSETEPTGSVTEPDGSETEPDGSESETQPDVDVEYDVNAAASYINTLYKKLKENNVTGADFDVVAKVMIAGVPYAVTWTTNNEKVTVVAKDETTCTVDLEHKTSEEYTYTLTATVTAGDGTTATVSFDLVVPVYNVATFEEYMAAEKGTNLVVEGIVVAMNSKSLGNSRNHLFLADESGKGGYYCYQLDMDPVEKGVKIGMTVAVTSVVEPYSGMQELKGGTFAIVDETIKTVDVLDITTEFAAGADLKNYVGLAVSIKGVTIGAQDMSKDSSQYLYFSLNDKTGYVRSYVTDFPTTLTLVKGENSSVSSPDKATMDADHLAHFGYTADVMGILVLYSGNPYLIPMSATPFTNYVFVEKTDAEKLEAEKDGLTFGASFGADAVVDLPAVGQYYPEDVTITWASDNEAITIADGKATIVVPDAAITVKVTATITCGTETATKEFTVKLSKEITTITDAIAIGAAKDHNTYTAEKYIVAGVIKEVYNTTYGNMYIVDELGNEFTVYGTYIEGKKYGEFEGAKPVAGDYVVVVGVLGQYNGTAQMKNADITSFTAPTTIPGVIESVKDFEKNQYTEDKVVISGEITEIQNATYGNVVIKDADGNSILVYGLYSANGAIRFDKMTAQPAVGDTITVLGIVGKYNDAQMKNGWLIAHTAATTDGGEAGGEGNTDPNPDDNTGSEDNTGDAAYTKVTSADQITTGSYVLVVAGGIAPSHIDGTWVQAATPVIDGDKVTDAKGAVWTITVTGTTATIKDQNGKFLAPKGGNSNGISEKEYSWDLIINDDGTVTFAGTGSDTVYFAYNTDAQYAKFRGYKTTTCADTATYPCVFTLYKLS